MGILRIIKESWNRFLHYDLNSLESKTTISDYMVEGHSGITEICNDHMNLYDYDWNRIYSGRKAKYYKIFNCCNRWFFFEEKIHEISNVSDAEGNDVFYGEASRIFDFGRQPVAVVSNENGKFPYLYSEDGTILFYEFNTIFFLRNIFDEVGCIIAKKRKEDRFRVWNSDGTLSNMYGCKELDGFDRIIQKLKLAKGYALHTRNNYNYGKDSSRLVDSVYTKDNVNLIGDKATGLIRPFKVGSDNVWHFQYQKEDGLHIVRAGGEPVFRTEGSYLFNQTKDCKPRIYFINDLPYVICSSYQEGEEKLQFVSYEGNSFDHIRLPDGGQIRLIKASGMIGSTRVERGSIQYVDSKDTSKRIYSPDRWQSLGIFEDKAYITLTVRVADKWLEYEICHLNGNLAFDSHYWETGKFFEIHDQMYLEIQKKGDKSWRCIPIKPQYDTSYDNPIILGSKELSYQRTFIIDHLLSNQAMSKEDLEHILGTIYQTESFILLLDGDRTTKIERIRSMYEDITRCINNPDLDENLHKFVLRQSKIVV